MSAQQQPSWRGARGKSDRWHTATFQRVDFLEYIVLIPLERTATVNRVSIERRKTIDTTDENILHIGGGPHADLIIYKNNQAGNAHPLLGIEAVFSLAAQVEKEPVHFSSQFKVFLTDQKTHQVQQENRTLRFWFFEQEQSTYASETNEFLRALLKAEEFPRGTKINELSLVAWSTCISDRLFLIYKTINGIVTHIDSIEKDSSRDSNVDWTSTG